MATTTMNSVIRSILTTQPDMLADEVIKKTKSRGITQSDETIRQNIYNIRSDIKKKSKLKAPATAQPTSAPKPAAATKPTAVAAKLEARSTVTPKPVVAAKPKPVSAPKPSAAVDLAGVFSNVTMVNTVVAACGGVEQARQVADAVRACGNLEAFLQHLDLVAGLRASAVAAE